MPYHSKRTMQPLIPANDYVSGAAHQRDVAELRRSTWQLVGTRRDLAKPGDTLAATVLGLPVVLRNFGDGVSAFRNVCAHRQCTIAADGASHSASLKCPYHGWHYGADGRTRKIPGAKNFPNFDREAHRLQTYAVQFCGELVFTRLCAPDDVGHGSLQAWMGDTFDQLQQATRPEHWTQNLGTHLDFHVNWKIPIEGSLESYHLDEVHAATFGHDPGEEHSEHVMSPLGTTFQTRYRTDSLVERIEERCIRWMTGGFDGSYRHLHTFPNLMASLNDSLSLVYQIVPTGPTTSRMNLWGFGRAASRGGWFAKMGSRAMRRASAKMALKVLNEDAAIFPLVQRGMTALCDDTLPDDQPATAQSPSPSAKRPGVFGRCEERLDAFHRDWQSRFASIGRASSTSELASTRHP
ncbi:aromatic ring-hydroxylating oxygenase subunit alpha [Crateriforma conspicua]|uniref:aromatic ring-hydroxylating oxygenase subunit alpha n=1 Tax=Crateriforma conspicua TaxID=2527996 RepID=UPI001187A7E1|nr:SRPBCC family protein [Crateriforma conspicua]QDV64385.1 Anthranilate 1,2-dioxygenase large subunit [Crateriforma conspicua]